MQARIRRRRTRPDDDTVLMGEAARVLGIHRCTAYEQARDGVLPAVWHGRRYEMKRGDLERVLRERAAVAAEAVRSQSPLRKRTKPPQRGGARGNRIARGRSPEGRSR